LFFLFFNKGVTSTPGWCSCDENSGLLRIPGNKPRITRGIDLLDATCIAC